MLISILVLISVVGVFLVSPNLLYMLGTGYSASGGSAIAKIHPCTYVLVATYFLQILSGRSLRFELIADREVNFRVAAIFILVVYCGAMGFVTSIPIVTLLTPFCLLALLQREKIQFLAFLSVIVRLVLVVNALVGVFEMVAGHSILEKVAGNVEVGNDARSIGLLGHPLSSSLVSGLMLVFLMREGIDGRVSVLSVLEMLIHVAGVLVFGGRLNLVIAMCLCVYALMFGRSAASGSTKTLIRVFMFFVFVIACIWASQSDFAEVLLSRLSGDEKNADSSSATRVAAVLLLLNSELSDLVTGISDARRAQLLGAFDTEYGIEVTWISWIFSFGVFWTAYLMKSLFRSLSKITCNAPPSLKYMNILFVIAMTGAQGLGGKTLALCWFFLMLVTFRAHLELKLAGE